MTSPAPLAAFAGYGLELEYMIVDRETLAIRPIADALLERLTEQATPINRFGWSNELVLHVLELKNRQPSPALDSLTDGFCDEVARANALLDEFGARLMPGGMHPWMDPATETRLWPHQDAAIYRAYDRIFDCRAHGWANIQSAQLNLSFADDDEFVRLHTAVRLLLPIMPALAASSPIADGRVQREADFRMENYRRHAAKKPSLIGRVVPDNATSLAGYQAEVLAPMYAEVAPFDPGQDLQQEWLNARGAIPRFDRHAMEIRVVDMQECPNADIAVAALVSAVARALYRETWSSLRAQQAFETEQLAALLDNCIRDAETATIGDPRYLAALGLQCGDCTAQTVWYHLFDACRDDALLDDGTRTALGFILENGPLARRLLHATGSNPSHGDLARVYGELCDCLVENRLFNARP
jgi:gamma-glutamyl:cysteine ligase YbdK (ATP-grasp superfamily)